MPKKLIRITTIPMALRYLLPGQMKYMKEHGWQVTMISADGEGREEVIKNEECPHIVVPLTRRITPFQDLKCLWKLFFILRRERPDIVHTHTPKAGLLGMLAAKIAGVPIRIHTVAGLPLMVEKGFKLKLLSLVEKITNNSATHVWPNSASLKKYIESTHLADPQKLSVISHGSSNGIDLDKFNPDNLQPTIMQSVKRSVGYDDSSRYLLYIGRVVADKGISELVTAFLQLQEKHAGLKLLLAGDFEQSLDPLPASIVTEIQQNENIILLPWTPHVAYIAALAHVMVFPSHREGFPNVLLQAGAMQLPIACSRIAGNVDLVRESETGYLFEPKNAQQIVEAVHLALTSPDKTRAMSMQLYREVKMYFGREQVWSAILSKYNEIMLNKSNRS